MRAIPLDVGVIHFVGIGGIGMSGIAEVLHNLGYSIQGSDLSENANVARLRKLGIAVAIGHDEGNLGEAKVVIVSSAVTSDNPEVTAARSRFIPVVGRSEMLGELMRLRWSIAVGGTHGKTTTTSMIAAVLDAARYDPTVINGGIINAYGTNARLGSGDWMVVESDESDGSFTKLPSTITVVTNIDPEHLDHYGSFDALRDAFETFVENIPFYGFAVMCVDHPEVQALIGRISDRRIITYGYSQQADFRAVEVSAGPEGMVFDAVVRDREGAADHVIEALTLPMHGRHNVLNAMAAIALAGEMGIAEDVTRRALAGFEGVKRRFTVVGATAGITVVDDYGHHPIEIKAVLEAARAVYTGRVIALVQPHRYSRLRDLFEDFCGCFNDADMVLVADVYAAGEEPIEGIDRDALVAGLQASGHRHVQALEDPEDPEALAAVIADMATAGDVVICLGAGTVTAWAQTLPGELERLFASRDAAEQGAGK